MLAATLITLVGALLPLAVPAAYGWLVHTLSTSEQGLVWCIVAVLAVHVLPDLLAIVSEYLDEVFDLRLEEGFLMRYLRKMQDVEEEDLDDPKFNDLLARADERGMAPLLCFVDEQFSLLSQLITLGLALTSLLLIVDNGWVLALLFLAPLPWFLAELWAGKDIWRTIERNTEKRRKYGEYQSYFDARNYLRDLKLFGAVESFLGRIRTLLRELNAEQLVHERKKLLIMLIATVTGHGLMGVAMVMVIFMVPNGLLAVGALLFVLGAISALDEAVSGLLSSVAAQHEYHLAVHEHCRILEWQPSIRPPAEPVHIAGNSPPAISLVDVSFWYRTSTAPVLSNVNIDIEPGERVAIVGQNGKGKSTLFKLLCRLYDPKFGEVRINGKSLRDLDRDRWWAQLAVQFQDFSAHSLPVREGIALGQVGDEINHDRLIDALSISGLMPFVDSWPKGLDTTPNAEYTGGIELSGGLWRRVALARTLYRDDARALFLDEPTAEVDAKGSAKFFKWLKSQGGDRTILVITHDADVVREGFDRVFQVDAAGCVAELNRQLRVHT